LTITNLKDNFDNLESKHHILQAIKYLAVKNEPFEEKEKVFDTIQPYTGKVKGFNHSFKLTDIVSKLFGYSYNIEKDTNTTIRVKGDPEFLPEVLEEAEDIGYSEVEMEMFSTRFEELRKAGLEGRVIENRSINNKPTLRGKIVSYAIRYTTPISYTIIGSLPGDLQNKISKYVRKNTGTEIDTRYATNTSNWIGFLGGAAGGIVNWAITGDFISTWTLLPLYTALESAIRGFVVTNVFNQEADSDDDKVGRLPFLPITMIARKTIASKEKKGEKIVASFKVKDAEKEKAKTAPEIVNAFEYFGRIAEMKMPEEVEQNLVYSTENHFNFGKEFKNYVTKETSKWEGQKPEFQEYIDKKNEKYNLFSVKTINGYNKLTTLVCSQNEKYILSFITGKDLKEAEEQVKLCNDVLAKDSDLIDKVKELTKKTESLYAHIIKVEGGKVVADYDITA